MDEKKIKNADGAQQLSDKEIEAVNGGMKIVVDEQLSWIKTILRFIFGMKDN